MASTERRENRLVQWVLRGGLIAASVLVAAGLAIALASGGESGAAVRLDALGSDASASDRVIAIGLVVLALTPLARVLALIAIWIRERDARFVALGAVVAAILVTSILSGCHDDAAGAMFSDTVNVEPCPGLVSTETVPACASTIALTMLRPSPRPGFERLGSAR